MMKTYENFKRILTGPRFGERDSDLAKLVSKVDALKKRTLIQSLNENDVTEYDSLKDIAFELQLGGACDHGADQGPNCRLCGGILKGKYVKRDTGLEVIDYAIAHAGLAAKEKDRLMMECDRIGDTLKDVLASLKQVDSTVNELRKRATVKEASTKRRKIIDDAGASIEEIKKSVGLNPETLKRSHDVLQQELSNAKVPLRFRTGLSDNFTGEILVSQADLEAEHDEGAIGAFEWLKREIVAEVQKRTGRIISFKGLQSRSGALDDKEAVIQAFELNQVEEDTFLLTECCVTGHLTYTECFQRLETGRSPSEPVHPDFLAKLKTQSKDGERLMFIHLPRIPTAFFDSLRYRGSIRQINLSGSSYSLMAMAHAIPTLVNLETLVIPAIVPYVTKEVEMADNLAEAFRVWSTGRPLSSLRNLDISGRKFITPDRDLVEGFCAFLQCHPLLERLSMDRCFHITKGRSLGDEECDAVTAFLTQRFVSALPIHLNELSFSGNAFTESTCATGFFRALLDRTCQDSSNLVCVNLADCRTWSCFEEEDDDERMTTVGNAFEEMHGLGQAWVKLMLECGTIGQSSITSLTLAGCKIGDEGLKGLAKYAQCLPRLQKLDVSEVGAGSAGIHALFTAVCDKWKSLSYLAVSGNDPNSFAFTPEVKEALCIMLSRAASLQRLEIAGFKGLVPKDVFEAVTGSCIHTLLVSFDDGANGHNSEDALMEAAPFPSCPSLQCAFLWGMRQDSSRYVPSGWTVETFSSGILLNRAEG